MGDPMVNFTQEPIREIISFSSWSTIFIFYMYTTITISIVYIIFYRPEMIIKEDDNYVYYPYAELSSNIRGLFKLYPGKSTS